MQVFWCISGFIFFWKYKTAIANKIVGGKKFYVLRFSRLYPLHLATLLLVALLQIVYFIHNNNYFVYQQNDITHFFLQLFLASDWVIGKGYSFNGPIWSISVEVLIYLIFFLLLRILGKSPLVNIGILLLCVIAIVAKVRSPIFSCLAFFYIGGLSAITFEKFGNTKYNKFLSSFALCIVCTAPLIVYFRPYAVNRFMIFFLLAYMPTLLYCASHNIKVAPSIKKIIEAAGNMTYSSYLMHFPIQLSIVLFYSYTNRSIPFYSTVFFTIFISITFLVSYFIYRYFEKPAQSIIRDKWK